MNTFDAHKRTVKEVFTYIYEIPFYQRGYSWKSDQIRQFWDDLMMVKEEGHSEYFMGSIVINEENKDLLQVIDGQQRLTTITIFLSAIRDLLIINNNKESAFNIHQNYIAERNIWGKDKFRLTLSEINLEFFQEFIQLPIDNDSRKGQDDFSKISNNRRRASNDLIWNAHLEIKTYVENYLIDNDNDLNSILELVELLTKSFLIISISVNSDTDAYIIFETLNDRGMDLSTADLLKNHLFSKVNKTEVSTVQRSWTELTNTLNQDNITTFLRHYWLAKYERVTDKKLYEKIKRYLQKRNVSVRNFVEELNASADIYVNIKNPTLSYWSDNELVKSLQNINTLNYKTAYSLILIGKLKLSNSNLKTIADACEKFVFKFTTICGYSPSEVEKIFGNVTKVLRDNGDNGVQDVLDMLKKRQPSDTEFSKEFANSVISKQKIQKYILEKIDNSLGTGERVVSTNSKEIHVEHIMPKKPNDWWVKATDNDSDMYEEYVDRIGNLTLLSRSLNQRASNKSYIDKTKNYYKNSEFKVTQDILNYDSWGVKQIELRQDALSKLASTIWSIS